ncbi:MAG: 30S ribosomal protein S20 [Eubacteriales bacterium]|nr:30S ribosomal protein S20 [Eubacteriales bacterium]MDD4326873.1 30S ribosomal protein S20 [Eubacteriales bacterium]MDD4716593.1 30S ribosomal protein S20 [Eubacteriales bacterium]
MPNIKSAIKRVSVTAKKTEVNKQQKSAVRTDIKKARTAVANGAPDAKETVDKAMVRIDKAASKGYMHKNTAARKKSRLAKALNTAE